MVFDGVVPDEAPDAAALYVAPDADGAFGSVGGRIEGPLIERSTADDPLLRFVDLASVHIGRAREVELAAGMRAVVASTRDAPLIAVGEAGGERIGLVAFDLDESDLPLQVAFPLLVSNVVDYLLPTADGILPSSMGLGESLSVSVDPEVTGVAVTSIGADGLPGAADGDARVELPVVDGRVTIPGAAAVGLREVRAISDDGAVDGTLLGTTAVNLFSADESDVAPGDPTRLTDMGRVPDDAPTSGQPSRTEWWWPLALVALALLAVEWILFHRPTRRTMARAFGRRPQPLGERGAMSFPLNFSDPMWLWLAVPSVVIVVVGWMAASRTLPAGRRAASLVIRLVLAACLVLSLAGMRLALPSDRLRHRVPPRRIGLDARRRPRRSSSSGHAPRCATCPTGIGPAWSCSGPTRSSIGCRRSSRSWTTRHRHRSRGRATSPPRFASVRRSCQPGCSSAWCSCPTATTPPGRQTDAIAAAAARGIRLDVVTPSSDQPAEVLIDELAAPTGARVGETIDMTVRVRSTVATGATIRLLADGATVTTRDIELEPGITTIPFSVTADSAGFHVFRAVIEPDEDRFAENNAADAYVVVTGPPQRARRDR